jgi:hypothetical protein
VNHSPTLFNRFTYLRELYQSKKDEEQRRKDEQIVEWHATSDHEYTLYHFLAYDLAQDERWLALAAVEAFFGWTEHVLIHLAILNGTVKSAQEVAALAEADWSAKFKCALDLSGSGIKASFDALLDMRRELRNYVAHGGLTYNC